MGVVTGLLGLNEKIHMTVSSTVKIALLELKKSYKTLLFSNTNLFPYHIIPYYSSDQVLPVRKK